MAKPAQASSNKPELHGRIVTVLTWSTLAGNVFVKGHRDYAK